MENSKIKLLILAFVIDLLSCQTSFAFVPNNIGNKNDSELLNFVFATGEEEKLLAESHEYKRFLRNYGNEFLVKWNKLTSTPHRIYGKGIALEKPVNKTNIEYLTRNFISKHGDLLRTDVSQLNLLRAEFVNNTWYVTYQQYFNNIPVYLAYVDFRIKYDKVILFGSDFHPQINVSTIPKLSIQEAIEISKKDIGLNDNDKVVSLALMILPLSQESTYQYRLAYQINLITEKPLNDWIYFIDAHNGEIIQKYCRTLYYNNVEHFPKECNGINVDDSVEPETDLSLGGISLLEELKNCIVIVLTGTVGGKILPEYYNDPLNNKEFDDEYINVKNKQITTDNEGSYNSSFKISDPQGIDIKINANLEGPYVKVIYEDGNNAHYEYNEYHEFENDFTLNVDWIWDTTRGRQDEINVFYHVNKIHGYTKNTLNYYGMDYQMRATVAYDDNFDNALYNPSSGYIYFGEGGSKFRNLALFSDVIYHEYTHGVTHHIYGNVNETMEFYAINEGISDYFACSLNEDSMQGDGGMLLNGSEYLRNLDNSLQYPEDKTEEPHDDGRIIGGACWDLRELVGASLADQLVHLARFGKPLSFIDYGLEILVADDNDGNIYNGTPHSDAIITAFANHGMNYNVPNNLNTQSLQATDTNSLTIDNVINYPNPFSNEGTNFSFQLSKSANINIKVYSTLGQLIKKIDTTAKEGFNSIPWDGKNDFGETLANGVYFYLITATDNSGNQVKTRGKLAVLR
jgi:Zn-dependent metalloprotease